MNNRRRPAQALRHFLAVAGPGLVVMLADTDAGSIITAAQSGALWGYKLLALQFVLAPVLYVVQELTCRLGIVTGKGHAELIERQFGRRWAWLSVATLVVSCVGALLTELSGLASVGALLGIPAALTMTLVVIAMVFIAYAHGYSQVERIAIAFGAFELAFLVVAIIARPKLAEVGADMASFPFGDKDYLYLVSANIGAVIMPWMVFFQQSSLVEKKIATDDLPAARLDTAIGAAVTQIIMAAVLVSVAATLGNSQGAHNLDTVQQISGALTPYLGMFGGRLLFGLGMTGAALISTIVVTLTAARTVSELHQMPSSLDHHPREAPWFYGVYSGILIVAAIVVTSDVNLVSLSIGIQVMNALLLPVVLGFLFLLARRLPEPWRLQGIYAWIAGVLIIACTGLGVYSGIGGILFRS